jgi:hypothetical protein
MADKKSSHRKDKGVQKPDRTDRQGAPEQFEEQQNDDIRMKPQPYGKKPGS